TRGRKGMAAPLPFSKASSPPGVLIATYVAGTLAASVPRCRPPHARTVPSAQADCPAAAARPGPARPGPAPPPTAPRPAPAARPPRPGPPRPPAATSPPAASRHRGKQGEASFRSPAALCRGLRGSPPSRGPSC
ncbi:unnamed protein product, partial [Bubo scandiacus]